MLSGYNKPNRTLSKSWFDSATPDKLSELKKDVSSFFRSYVKEAKASQDDIMWTCPVNHKSKIQGSRYICSRIITKEERRLLSQPELKQLEKAVSCFVPCNAKATNIYRNRWALAYCYNMFLKPPFKGFFQDNGIEVDESSYSLSCLLQWICRSRLRDGESIVIYLPSKRMRKLLQDWLGRKC